MKRLFAATAVAATVATGLPAPALADPPLRSGDRQGPGEDNRDRHPGSGDDKRHPGPGDRERYARAEVHVGSYAAVNRDGDAGVHIAYRLRGTRHDRSYADLDVTVRQGRAYGHKVVHGLRDDGRWHTVWVHVDGRRDFRAGRAYVDADLNTRGPGDQDRRKVYLHPWRR